MWLAQDQGCRTEVLMMLTMRALQQFVPGELDGHGEGLPVVSSIGIEAVTFLS
jgi:uncharacterized membrane-anchored protein